MNGNDVQVGGSECVRRGHIIRGCGERFAANGVCHLERDTVLLRLMYKEGVAILTRFLPLFPPPPH